MTHKLDAKLKILRRSNIKKDPEARAAFFKPPNIFSDISNSLNRTNFDSVTIYFQDEFRFGLKTFVGRCLSKVGVLPKVAYQHKFANTYLWHR